MDPVQGAVTSVLRNALNLNGRAARPEFWWFALTAFVVYVMGGWILGASRIVNPVLAVLTLAVAVRRLHDTGRSGWWVIPLYVPFAGSPVAVVLTLWTYVVLVGPLSSLIVTAVILVEVAVLVMLAQPGARGPNRYGPDPLQPTGESMRERADAPVEMPSSTGSRWTGNAFIYPAVSAAVVLVAVIAAVFMLSSPDDDGTQVDLTRILAMAENGQITSITVDGDRLIAAQRQNNQQLIASKAPGSSIFELLQSAGIDPVEHGITIEVQRNGGLENAFGILAQFLPVIFFGALLLAGIFIVLLLPLLRRR